MAHRFRHLATPSARSDRSPNRRCVLPAQRHSQAEDILSPPPSLHEEEEDEVLSVSQSQTHPRTRLLIDEDEEDEEDDVLELGTFSPSKRYRTHQEQEETAPKDQAPLQLGGGVEVPAHLAMALREYQKTGVEFMHGRWQQDAGCILGDDMGLGKTLQVISLMAALLNAAKGKDCKFLVLAPLTTLEQWAGELQRWVKLPSTVYHGSSHAKQVSMANLVSNRVDIMLTSYETYQVDSDELSKMPWTAVFLDELHRLKSMKTKLYKACLKLRCRRRIGMTGTLVQNNLKELYAVVNFVHPGCFGTLQNFNMNFILPIKVLDFNLAFVFVFLIFFSFKAGLMSTASGAELAHGKAASETMYQRLAPMYLRRTKEECLRHELPEKEDSILFCTLTELQIQLYSRVLEQPEIRIVKESLEVCGLHGTPRRQCCLAARSTEIQAAVLRALSNLRKVANHVYRIVGDERLSNALLNPTELESIKQMHLHHDTELSGKFRVLAQLLPQWKAENGKVLIFSQSTKTLDLLARFLQHLRHSFLQLDGSTPEARRQPLIDEFNRNAERFIFLISTKTGGTGLNLCAANYAVIFDPDWNSANDAQAADRIYRFGQKRKCHIYRFVSVGTIEENMYMRQIYKQQLGNTALNQTNEKRYFANDDLFGIQNLLLENTASSRTLEVLSKTQKQYEILPNANVAGDANGAGEVSSVLDAIMKQRLASVRGTDLVNAINLDGDEEIGEDEPPPVIPSVPSGVLHSHRLQDLVGENDTERQLKDDAVQALDAPVPPALTAAERRYEQDPALLEKKRLFLERRRRQQENAANFGRQISRE